MPIIACDAVSDSLEQQHECGKVTPSISPGALVGANERHGPKSLRAFSTAAMCLHELELTSTLSQSPTEPFPVFDDEDDTTITTNFVGSPPIPRNRARRNAMASSTPLELPIAGANRGQSASASQASSIAGNSYTNGATNNGSGGAGNNYASPLPAGHQQDLNYLYDQIQELSRLLQANRAKTAELTRVAERAEVVFMSAHGKETKLTYPVAAESYNQREWQREWRTR